VRISLSSILDYTVCPYKTELNYKDNSIDNYSRLKDVILQEVITNYFSMRGRGISPTISRVNTALNKCWSSHKSRLTFQVSLRERLALRHRLDGILPSFPAGNVVSLNYNASLELGELTIYSNITSILKTGNGYQVIHLLPSEYKDATRKSILSGLLREYYSSVVSKEFAIDVNSISVLIYRMETGHIYDCPKSSYNWLPVISNLVREGDKYPSPNVRNCTSCSKKSVCSFIDV
jgi:hypothetical protein